MDIITFVYLNGSIIYLSNRTPALQSYVLALQCLMSDVKYNFDENKFLTQRSEEIS